jgi:hypothetical protein
MPRRKQVDTKQIQAPNWDNYEIVIIRSKTGYDEEWIQDRSTAMTAGQMDMRILGGTSQKLTLIRCIESWTFTDENNQPLPWPPLSMREADNIAIYQIREQSLAYVFPEDRNYIFNEITELSKPMTKEEKKGSSMSVSPGSQENHATSLTTLSNTK